MPDWFWGLTILLGCLGIALFGVSYVKYEEDGPARIPRWARMTGLAGLLLLAWGVLLASVGVVVAIAQALA